MGKRGENHQRNQMFGNLQRQTEVEPMVPLKSSRSEFKRGGGSILSKLQYTEVVCLSFHDLEEL